MDNMELLTSYKDVSEITGEMVNAARSGDWDRLTELEKRCYALVEIIKAAEPVQLTGEMQQYKVALIRKILADDAEIRSMTEPWMARLQTLLGGVALERKLRRAYDLDQGPL